MTLSSLTGIDKIKSEYQKSLILPTNVPLLENLLVVFQADLRIADMFMNQGIHDPVYSPFLKQKNNPDKALDKILEMQYLTAQLTPHARVRGDVAEMVGEIMAIQIGMNYT